MERFSWPWWDRFLLIAFGLTGTVIAYELTLLLLGD